MIKNSVYSVIERLLTAGLKFGAVIYLGHVLGAQGQGVYSLYIAVWAWSGTFSSLGMGITNNFFGAKDPSPGWVSALFGNTIVYSIGSGALAVAITWLLATSTDIFRAFPSNQLNILLLGVFLYAFYTPLLGLLVGLEEFKLRMYSTLVLFGFFLGLLFWQHQTGRLSIFVLGTDWLLATSLLVFVWIFQCWKRSGYRISLSKQLFKEQISYGIKSYGYLLGNNSLTRVDMLIVSYLLGAEAAGVYSVAVYFAEVLLYFPSALTTVLLASVGGGHETPKEFYRTTSSLFLVAILGTALAIPVLVPVLFPPQYLAAILLSEIMLVGVYWLGMGTIGAFHVLGREILTVPLYATLAAVITEVSLDFILIPSIGLIGAAIADTLAYILFGIVIFRFITKLFDCSIFSLLLPLHPLKLISRLKESIERITR